MKEVTLIIVISAICVTLEAYFECKVATLKNTTKLRSLTRSIMALVGTKKQLSTYQRLPNTYYKHVYIEKRLFDGIELVAKIERKSKKKATDFLLEAGFGSYMGAKLAEHVKNEQKIKESNLKQHPYPSRFVKELRKFCKERGMDIRKII